MQPLVHVIVVTHNSENVLGTCVAAINEQSESVSTITIVDSGSSDTSYLNQIEDKVTSVIRTSNVGFSRANNLGYGCLQPSDSDLILFLNPDAFLFKDAIARLKDQFTNNPSLGCVTGKLLGYDLEGKATTGLLDSTGVFRKWYGRWFDRGQGQLDDDLYPESQLVPAVCGALMCCSVQALRPYANNIFDENFFMYKEDIELSLRLRESGWKLLYTPDVLAYHCRGWKADRKDVSYNSRLLSAQNEMKLYFKHPSVYIIWALSKYLIVRLLRM